MISITRADPHDFVELIEAGDAYMATLYPAASNHMLDVETLCQPQIHFFGAFIDSERKGCGGFWAHQDYVEIKRVFVVPSARGLGLSISLMQAIENAARDLGFRIARLETGIHQPEALGLYQRLGYKLREPFGDYQPDPLSLFMEKAL